MRPWRYICANCYNRLRFSIATANSVKKGSIPDDLETRTQERNMETKQITIFFIYFLNPNCL